MLRPEGTSGVVGFLNSGLVQDIPQRFSYYGPCLGMKDHKREDLDNSRIWC